MTPLQIFRAGFLAGLPLMVGVAPFGIVFGALAVGAGMTSLQALGMSILVIAGSSQFVATGLIAEQTPFGIIILTTFIINLRHFLYSTSLTRFLQPLSLPWKSLIGYLMIDEVYAPSWHYLQTENPSPQVFRWYFFGAGTSLASVWWTTTLVGTWLGAVMSEDTVEKLGFTLPLIFTSIVVSMLVSRSALLAALSAAAAGILCAPLPNNLGLIVAAAVGIMVGVLSEKPRKPNLVYDEIL